jgi:hypothetical protein
LLVEADDPLVGLEVENVCQHEIFGLHRHPATPPRNARATLGSMAMPPTGYPAAPFPTRPITTIGATCGVRSLLQPNTPATREYSVPTRSTARRRGPFVLRRGRLPRGRAQVSQHRSMSRRARRPGGRPERVTQPRSHDDP